MSEPAVYHNALDLKSTLAEYRLESVLGVGGFGITYLARDTHLEKRVAIKEYLPGDLAIRALDGSVVPVSTDHQFDYQWGLDSFIQEARTLARFSHPNIVRVNRYFEANSTGYMVMDYEDGESLNQLLKRVPFPAEAELKRILMPLLDGLAAVHAENFLHRDIKPSNIFIRADGSPVLLDFGAARATGGGTRSMTAIVTPGYAPLEQYAKDGKQGPWSDIYALGGVLFRAVTNGNPPDAVSRMQGDGIAESLAAARARYSAPMLHAIEWGLMLKAELRPQSIAEWKAAFIAQESSQVLVAEAGAIPAAHARTVRLRTARPESDPGAAWRRIGWGVVLLVAVVAGLGWYKTPDTSRELSKTPIRKPAQHDAPVAAQPAVPQSIEKNSDQTGSNALSSREFAPGADVHERPSRSDAVQDRMRERINEDFRGADRDGDGYLSAAEVEGRFPVLAREFGRIDRDGDGRISLDEFIEMRRLQFESRQRLPEKPDRK